MSALSLEPERISIAEVGFIIGKYLGRYYENDWGPV